MKRARAADVCTAPGGALAASPLLDPRALNAAILYAPTTAALLALVPAHGARFTDVNAATALLRASRATPPPPYPALEPLCLACAAAFTAACAPRGGGGGGSGGASSRTLSAACHAAGALGLVPRCAPLSRSLEALSAASLAALDPGALSALLWLAGKAPGWAPGGGPLSRDALATAAAAAAPRMRPEELAGALWGAAAARLYHAPLLAALAAAAGGAAARGALGAQALATAAWAAAKLRHADGGRLAAALRAAALAPLKAGAFGGQDLAQFAYALARWDSEGEGGGGGEAWRALAAAATAAAAARALAPPALASLLAAFASGGGARGGGGAKEAVAAAAAALAAAAAAALPALAPNEVGALCMALARGAAPPAGLSSGALAAAVAAAAPLMAWRSVGAADAALRAMGGGGGRRRARADAALAARAAAAVGELGAAADAAAGAPAALLLSLRPAPWDGAGALLLVGGDPGGAIAGAAAAGGAPVAARWARFAFEGGGAAAWPLPPSAPCGCAVLRFPSAGGAASLALLARGAAGALRGGARLIVYGSAREGLALPAAAEAVAGDFEGGEALGASVDGSVVVAFRRRAAAPGGGGGGGSGGGGLAAFARDGALALPGCGGCGGANPCGPRAWRTYPGLFAEGGIDVMTRALLGALPAFPPRARVLDFCCGSGAIGAALLAAAPALRVTLCDADALAVAAARANVPAARRVLLADGWPPHAATREGRRKWNAIVSNPPVHGGLADDLRVLAALVAGAAGRLRPGGALLVVAQLHVPVGALMGGARGLAGVSATRVEGGRFVVWRAEAL
jgi:hypothetical protein